MFPFLSILVLKDYVVIGLLIYIFTWTTSLDIRRALSIRRLERKIDALLAHHGIQLPTKLSPEVQRLAADPKQKIAAIKLHREQTGVSLAVAKAEVEEFMN